LQYLVRRNSTFYKPKNNKTMPPRNNTLIKRESAKQYLAYLWGLGSTILVVSLMILTFKNGGITDSRKYWSWFLPHLVPSLALIISVIIVEANRNTDKSKVGKFHFRCSMFVSLFYLVAIAIFIAIVIADIALYPDVSNGSYFKGSDAAPFEYNDLFDTFDLILGTFSGFVTATLGIFFIQKTNNS